MSDGVKAETQVTTKRYPEAPRTPEKVGGVQPGAQEPQEMVGTPEPGGDLPLKLGDPAVALSTTGNSSKETDVLPAPTKKPKANCKRCHGRGYEGTYPATDAATGRPGIGKAICACVKLRR